MTSTPKPKLTTEEGSTPISVVHVGNLSLNFGRSNRKIVGNDVDPEKTRSAKSDNICYISVSKTATDILNLPENAKKDQFPTMKPNKVILHRFKASRLSVSVLGCANNDLKKLSEFIWYITLLWLSRDYKMKVKRQPMSYFL